MTNGGFNMMKKILVGMICAAAIFAVDANAAGSKDVALDNIVAVVNSDVITQSELDEQLAQARQRIQASHAPIPDFKKLRKQVLDQLINEKLAMQIAKRNNVVITDAQVDAAINRIATHNNLTLAQLKVALGQQGMQFSTYKKQIREQMLMSTISQHVVGGSVSVTDQEVKDFMRQHPNTNMQYHLADILIALSDKPTPGQTAAAQKQADSILTQARRGANFQQLAAANSTGKEAVQGGDLGWRSAAELPEIFVNDVAKMKVGDVAGPITAPNGLHLIKLLAERGSGPNLSAMQVKQLLFQQKVDQKMQQWLQSLRATAYVKIIAQ